MLVAAVGAHEKGDLDAAEQEYRAVLAITPDLPDALQLLGVVRHQKGESDALEFLTRAKALAPRNPNIRINLGGILNAGRRHAEAAEEFRAALALDPNNAQTWCNLGMALRALEKGDDSVAAFERSITLDPKAPKPRYELANLWLAVKDYPRCEAAYRGYVALVPDDVASLSNLAYAVQCQGRLEEADELFARAISATKEAPDLLRNMLLVRQGKSAESLAGFRALLKERPELWTTHLGLALGLMARGATDEAMKMIEDILDVFPDDIKVWNDVAMQLLIHGKTKEAAAMLERGVKIDPTVPQAHNTLGAAYLHLHRSDLAIPALHNALRCRPDYIDSHLNLARAYRKSGDFDLANVFAKATMDLPDFRPKHFISLNQTFRATCDFESLERLGNVWSNCDAIETKHLPGVFLDLLVHARTREETLSFVKLVRRWAEYTEAQANAAPLPLPQRRRRASGERLKIGFLSSDLRSHSVARFLQFWMQKYDRSRFAFHCYSSVRAPGDSVQTLLQESVDKFMFVENLTNYELAKTIRDDDIDILFELNGFTESTRVSAVAWRPAPVQISWIGYPFTCGLKALDHVIVDRFAQPADPAFMTEEPIVMPDAWICFGEFADVPIEPGLPKDRNGVLTFGTLNSPYKYTREMIAVWTRVMREVPDSRFLIVRPEARSMVLVRNIAAEFERNGISPDRLFFFDNKQANQEKKNHLAYYNEIDISLDTFPLTGGTTTCEATWMGVPVVSLVGDSFHQRISYSILMQCGLGELCADTEGEFVAKAVALADDEPRLRAYRQTLRDVVRQSPLCDKPRFIHQFQEMLEQVAAHHGLR